MIRCCEEDRDNPYDIDTRIMQIAQALSEEDFLAGVDFTILVVPNIEHITYGRDVGYTIEKEELGEEIESISGTKIRADLQSSEERSY